MEKKCPHCHEWTAWENKLSDRCTHCNELLEKKRVEELNVYKAREKAYQRSDWFNVKETDGLLMKATRKVGLFFHIVFGAISWFFIWMFVNVAG